MKTLADRAQAFLANPWRGKFSTMSHKARTQFEPGFRFARTKLRQARRFQLDDSFVVDSVRAASSTPAAILSRSYLANLPFDSVWLEFSMRARLEEQWRLGTMREEPVYSESYQSGFLLYRLSPDDPSSWIAESFVDFPHDEGRPGAVIGFAAHALYGNNEAGRLHYFRQLDEAAGIIPDEFRHHLLYGWGFARPPGEEDVDKFDRQMLELGARGGTVLSPALAMPVFRDEPAVELKRQAMRGWVDSAEDQRGDLRWLVTVLAMLNHTPVRYTHQPATGRFTNRLRNIEYLDSHVVTIHPGRTSVVRILDKAARQEAQRRRRHEVRGHWRLERGKGLPGCHHLPESTDGQRGRCQLCGGAIYWLDAHMRGDASLGFVRKEYEVER